MDELENLRKDRDVFDAQQDIVKKAMRLVAELKSRNA